MTSKLNRDDLMQATMSWVLGECFTWNDQVTQFNLGDPASELEFGRFVHRTHSTVWLHLQGRKTLDGSCSDLECVLATKAKAIFCFHLETEDDDRDLAHEADMRQLRREQLRADCDLPEPFDDDYEWLDPTDVEILRAGEVSKAYDQIGARVKELAEQYPELGITFGYVGDICRGRDNRDFRIFTNRRDDVGRSVMYHLGGINSLPISAGNMTEEALQSFVGWALSCDRY